MHQMWAMSELAMIRPPFASVAFVSELDRAEGFQLGAQRAINRPDSPRAVSLVPEIRGARDDRTQ